MLDVDPGASTNRTVYAFKLVWFWAKKIFIKKIYRYTFVGEPEDVILGALAAARVAHKLIDMQVQKGEHPRIGLNKAIFF